MSSQNSKPNPTPDDPKERSSTIEKAYPPFESIILICIVLICCISTLPKVFDTIDDVATLDVLTSPLFPHIMSKYVLGYIRIGFAIFIFLVTLKRMSTTGHIIYPPYMKHSKLKRLPIQLDGLRSQMMFTCWCWNILGISFMLHGIITIIAAKEEDATIFQNKQLDKILLRTSLILFEIAASTSMLVSFVVRYALWPQSIKASGKSVHLRKPMALIQHNVNVIATLLEVGVLGKIPVRLQDVAVGPLYGIVYICATYFMIHRWVPSGDPQFVYFFFDTTLGKKFHSITLIVLMIFLTIFFYIFEIVDDLLLYVGGGSFIWNVILVLGIASCFCRFRD